MAFKVEKVPNEPIVISTISNPYDAMVDSAGIAQELLQILSETSDTIYYVADMSNLNVSFSELTVGLAHAFRTPGSPYANPRLKTLPVGSAGMIKFGVEAASQQSNYGKQQIQLYASVDEALAFARDEIAKTPESN